MRLKLAIDFDDTITKDPELFGKLIQDALVKGYDVRIVTFRGVTGANTDLMCFNALLNVPIIFTDGQLKAPFCKRVHGWEPDIWIDDNPHWCGTEDKG